MATTKWTVTNRDENQAKDRAQDSEASQRQQQACDSGDSRDEIGREVPPLVCQICGKDFSRRYERDRQMNEVHSGFRCFKCPDCDQVFTQESNMTRHKKAAHSDHPPFYKCDIWYKLFTQPGTLNRHKYQVHSGSCFKCNECPASYARKEKLRQHIKSGRHHIEYYCICCKKNIIFKSLKSKENHCKDFRRYGATYISCKHKPFPRRTSKNRIGRCPSRKNRL